MRSLNVAARIARYLRTRAYHLVGKDPLTRERVTRRADLRNIGSRYGGWSVPADLIDASSVCYCVGCGEDISFDLGLIEQFRCEVFAFDPTPRAIQYVKRHAAGNPHYHFSELGLWDKADRLKFYAPNDPSHVSHSLLNLQKTSNYFEASVERLSTVMRNNQHGELDLLKLDIEGAEYKVLDSIFSDGLSIAILCVEFDEYRLVGEDESATRIQSYVRQILDRGYTMIHASGGGNYTFIKNDAIGSQGESR